MLFSVQNSNNEKWQYKILPARILRAKRWQQSLLHRKKIHLQLNTRGARANNKTSVDTRYLYLRRASYVDCETNKKTPHKISRNSLFRYFRLIFNLCLIICRAALRTAITAPRKKKSYPDDPKQQSTNKKNKLHCDSMGFSRKLSWFPKACWRTRNAPNKLNFSMKMNLIIKKIENSRRIALTFHFSLSTSTSASAHLLVHLWRQQRRHRTYGSHDTRWNFHFSEARHKKKIVPFIQWKVRNTMAKIDIIQNEKKNRTKDSHSCEASDNLIFFINSILKTSTGFAANVASVNVCYCRQKRWMHRGKCEYKRCDASDWEGVSGERGSHKCRVARNILNFYCECLSVTCLHFTCTM